MIIFKLICGFAIFFSLQACTLSFQNISTHGSAEDLVDQNQETSPTIDAAVEASGLPL